MAEKFLIIQTAFIGDVVLATGIVEKLHAFYPDAEIDFLLRKGNEQLLTGHPFLHEVLVWDKSTSKLPNLVHMLSVIRKRKYDKVINVHRFATTGFLTAFSRAGETIGYIKNPFSFLFSRKVEHVVSTFSNPVHEIERCNMLISHFTDEQAFLPKLYPSRADRNQVKAYQHNRYICIAPSSVWFTKQYPAEQWIDFLNQVPLEFNIFVLGAPGDKKAGDDLISQSGRDGIQNLCGSLSFLASAALMAGADMNFVNDSAPMHFASAMDAPVAAIYCSTIPAFGFGPLSTVQHIVEIREPLSCRPCGLHGYKACPLKHFRCAHDIRTEQLLSCLPL